MHPPQAQQKKQETTEEGAEKALLKEYAKQHFDLFLHHATDESALTECRDVVVYLVFWSLGVM